MNYESRANRTRIRWIAIYGAFGKDYPSIGPYNNDDRVNQLRKGQVLPLRDLIDGRL